jgi:L,D-peptidoglycan transpeptidase YkuD (ErfK/YbiS/YcfS/YnhG family)
MTHARRTARAAGLALIAVSTIAAGLLAPSPADATSTTSTCDQQVPTELTHIGSSTQVVVATASSWSSTAGSLSVYEKRAGTPGTGWCLVLGPYKARFGYGGLVMGHDRRKNTGTTPAGTYTLPKAFGLNTNPGTALPYTHSDSNDYWALDPAYPWTFNTYRSNGVHGFRASQAEHIAHFNVQYRYAAVIGFNLPSAGHRADRTIGGAIFLHVNGSGATAGCVSVYQSAMVKILRRLDPARHPMIVISPTSWIRHA